MTSVRRKNRFLLLPLILLVIPFRLVGVVYKESRDLAKSTRKGISKRVSRTRRRRTNERADTHDVALRNPKPKITQRNCNECSFLKLPLELRQQVYDQCFRPTAFTIHELASNRYKLITTKAKNLPFPPLQLIVPKKELLELPLTCRQLYCETIEYLYTKTAFRFTNHDLAMQLPRLSVFPRKHLDNVRALELKLCVDILVEELNFGAPPDPLPDRSVDLQVLKAARSTKLWRRWTALWVFLAGLPRLERLQVEFARLSRLGQLFQIKDWMCEWLLEPLMRFERRERLRVFVVEWPRGWKPSGEWKQSSSMPFELKWV